MQNNPFDLVHVVCFALVLVVPATIALLLIAGGRRTYKARKEFRKTHFTWF